MPHLSMPESSELEAPADILSPSKTQNQNKDQSEYAVYVYRSPNRHNAAHDSAAAADWERKITTKNKQRALMKARRLYADQDVTRVEVKHKIKRCAKGAAAPRAMDKTVKCYQKIHWRAFAARSFPLTIGVLSSAIIIIAFMYYALWLFL